MSAPRTDTFRLQELIRLYRMGVGVRERTRTLKMGTHTEARYRKVFAEAGILEGEPGQLPELSVLRAAVKAALPTVEPRVPESSAAPWKAEIEAALKRGAGPTAIWDRLRRLDPEFTPSLSAVKRLAARIERHRAVRPEDVAIAVITEAGAVAQADFGFAGWFFDPSTGKTRKAWVFVMVLGHSRHMFARLVLNQRSSTWAELHVEAFKWFGGVPRTVVPDNLKAAVVRAAFGVTDRDNLALNRTYREVARHYGFKIDPTPPYQPEKKGKVERGVQYVKRNFLAAGGFETLADANADLPDWLVRTAGERLHGATKRRPIELFLEEQPALLALPRLPYELITWKEAMVHRDGHIDFDGRLYSVPWPLIGRPVWVQASQTSVKVYVDDERVATHSRRGTTRRCTVEAHLPEHRADLAQRSEAYWIKRAGFMGDEVTDYVLAVLASDEVLSRPRDVQAIVTHLEKFPVDRARGACRRAHFFGSYSYRSLTRILAHALDLEPLPGEQPTHGRLSQPRFARSASELVGAEDGTP